MLAALQDSFPQGWSTQMLTHVCYVTMNDKNSFKGSEKGFQQERKAPCAGECGESEGSHGAHCGTRHYMSAH